MWPAPRVSSRHVAAVALAFAAGALVDRAAGSSRTSILVSATVAAAAPEVTCPEVVDFGRQPTTTFEALLDRPGTRVLDLRAGERLLLWEPEPGTWNAETRASLFVRCA